MYVLQPRHVEQRSPFVAINVSLSAERLARRVAMPAVKRRGSPRAAAAVCPNTAPRSLDAIHLATGAAVFGTRLTAFVSYDERLLTAAVAVGLPTAAPGR